MPISQAQKQNAEQKQKAAASEQAPQVRLLAGPGTGKSKAIENRVLHLLGQGVPPAEIYVISFTRLTCKELRERIRSASSSTAFSGLAQSIAISTMHSLALRILRKANLLTAYPSTPTVLDDWEQRKVYDSELAAQVGCTPRRASEIRLAYDAQWQTLSPAQIAQAKISRQEKAGFQTFHATRTHLYSCVLPGEVIHRCVESIQQGALTPAQLPTIAHLIVDEYQDLNACDQEFIRLLAANGAILFIAGDDDQSIYSFRHANPDGIVDFANVYPSSATHVLTDCFRCTPTILGYANQLIQKNPNRVPKNLTSLYAASNPPVQGSFAVWQCKSPQDEAKLIAESCVALQRAGLQGREDEIVILIANRRVQLQIIEDALNAVGIPFDPPRGKSAVDESEGIRAGFSILRMLRDLTGPEPDYPAYRDLLELLSGVGSATAKGIGDGCVKNNQNFRELFALPSVPTWLNRRESAAWTRVAAVVQLVTAWAPGDTIADRATDIGALLQGQVFTSGKHASAKMAEWQGLIASLPPEMRLEELLTYLSASDEAEQEQVLADVHERAGQMPTSPESAEPKRIRILTMHGAKGLSGSVVFIPGAEAGLIPNFKALKATGLLIEQRRLFYVSATRAKACCIVSHATTRTGASALALVQRNVAKMSRSSFLADMGAMIFPGKSGRVDYAA